MRLFNRRSMLQAAVAGGTLLAAGPIRAEERGAIEAGARKEGAMALATSVNVPAFPKFLQAFTAKYPFINVNNGLFQGATATVAARVDAEMKSGKPAFDVIHIANPALYLDYAKQGLLEDYSSPELAAYPASAHNGGLWTTARAVGVMLAYNRNVVPADKAPSGWRDLLKPEFKGHKLAIQNAASGTWLMAVYMLEQTLGADYVRQLAAQQLIITTGSAQQIDMINRGEAMVAAGIDHTVLFTRTTKEAGVIPVYPTEGMPVSASPVAILKGAPHPNAARLFVDFMLSKQGQELFDNEITRNYSLRDDVPTPAGEKPLAQAKPLVPSNWDDYERFARGFPHHFNELFKS